MQAVLELKCAGAKIDHGLPGKSSITEFIREHVLGHNVTQLLDNPNEALADFNAMLEGCVYCVLEEPQQATKGEWHKLSSQLKNLCTGSTIGIHKKHKDSL